MTIVAENDLCIDKDGLIYFCGDSFYGHYTLEEFEELLRNINLRYVQLEKQLRDGKKL